MIYSRLVALSALCLLVFASSCDRDDTDPAEQAAKDKEIIETYITDNNLTALQTGSGLYYVINNSGGSTKPNSNSTVTVTYRGYYTNGNEFDASGSGGSTFSLNSVIAGWTEGIPVFGVGGSGILLIPSALGYGPDGRGDIPGNTVLIFDVELLDIQ